MSDASVTGLDYSRTLYLPKTDFPMRGGLPQKEPEILARWARENLYGELRESGKGRPKFVLHDGPPLRQRQCPHRHGAQQDAEGHCRALASDDGPGIQLRARLGLSRAADRMEGRGRILPKQGQGEARLLGFASHHRLPQGMPRLRRTLALRAAGGIQAARRRRRLGSSLHDDELSGRSADRPRDLQIRRERAALSRLEAGDVERGREDGACGGRGRIRGPCQRHDLRGVPGRGSRARHALRERRHLDDDALDDSGQPRDRLFAPHSPTGGIA